MMATRDTVYRKRGQRPKAAAKKSSAKNDSTSDVVVGFEEKLWQMMDKRRNDMDELVRVGLRVIVKRILRKYGYPFDKQGSATNTVLWHAELLSDRWTKASA